MHVLIGCCIVRSTSDAFNTEGNQFNIRHRIKECTTLADWPKLKAQTERPHLHDNKYRLWTRTTSKHPRAMGRSTLECVVKFLIVFLLYKCCVSLRIFSFEFIFCTLITSVHYYCRKYLLHMSEIVKRSQINGIIMQCLRSERDLLQLLKCAVRRYKLNFPQQ